MGTPSVRMQYCSTRLLSDAADFDVIHCHIDWLHLPILRRLGFPFLTTLHGRLDLPPLKAAVQQFGGTAFVSISNHQRTSSA